jgi:hypothetical protein
MLTVIMKKARQRQRLAEIRVALMASGLCSLDRQARALGLVRSTAYHVISASHKSTGISARVLMRMLASPDLPPLVRAVIERYAREKMAGDYGATRSNCRKFSRALNGHAHDLMR